MQSLISYRQKAVCFPSENLHETLANNIRTSKPAAVDEEFYIIQFWRNPDEIVRAKLKAAGIELLEYIPDNAFTAVVTGNSTAKLGNGQVCGGLSASYKEQVFKVMKE